MDTVTECVDAEYLLENSPDFLRTVYGDVRVQRAGLKTGCKIEVTKRILRRLVSPGNWTRLSILRVTGPNEKSIVQFNRLVEACVPLHSHRKEYPKRNTPALLSKPINQLEVQSSKSTPKARTRLTPMKRSVFTPLPVDTPLSDQVQSENSSSDHNRPNSTSIINASRKIALHIRSKGTPKPKPRAQSKILPESALLSSPMKDMINLRNQIPGPHISKPENVAITRHPSEKQIPRAPFATPITTDRSSSRVGTARRSNFRNTTATDNTKRLHLSKSKLNEFEPRQTGESSPSTRRPRRPRSLVMKNRIKSSSDFMSNVKYEPSHHSKTEMREVPYILSPLVSAGPRAEHKKSKRTRKIPLSNTSSPERSIAKWTPSVSPFNLNDKTKQKSEKISGIIMAVKNEPSNSSIHKATSTTSHITIEAKFQTNRAFEGHVDKLPRETLGIINEMTADRPKIPLEPKRSGTPEIKTLKPHTHSPLSETVMFGALTLDKKNRESAEEKLVDLLIVEREGSFTNPVANALLREASIINTISVIDTVAHVSSGPVVIKDTTGLIHEAETAESKFEEPADTISRLRSILHSPIAERIAEVMSSDQVCDVEIESSTACANILESMESRSMSIKKAQLPHSQLFFVGHVPINILKTLHLPVYEEGTDVGVKVNPKVFHLIEHVISVLSEEIMPSPMSTYGLNYSNAEPPTEAKSESRDSKNVTSFGVPLPSRIGGYSRRSDKILYGNSSERRILIGDQHTGQFEYEIGEKLGNSENREKMPLFSPTFEESYNQNQNQLCVNIPGGEISESEYVKMYPQRSSETQENHQLELQKCIVVKGKSNAEKFSDLIDCTAVGCAINKEKMNCVFLKNRQTEETALENGLPTASILVEMKSPKQMTVKATVEGRKNEAASPGPDSLPTSTSSVPLELPGALNVTEFGGQQNLGHSKALRLVKSAGASPLCFDLTIDISKSNKGSSSHGEFSQNCNASAIISIDLEDQENTHNANTDFSNKGRMESPVSFTPVTDLQEEGCGTSTMESFYRVVEPVLGLEGVVRHHPDDRLADSTFNVSETSNATTYASSLESESFY